MGRTCKVPPPLPPPDWVPKDLPLPKMVPIKDLGKTAGYYEGLFVFESTTTKFARFVLKVWPEHGFQLGRGDSEPGEVEDSFAKPPAVGAFKAQDRICKKAHYVLMLLVYTPDRRNLPVPGTGGSGSPISPAPSPSATPSSKTASPSPSSS